MALSIVNNTASLNAQNNLSRTNSTLSKSLEKLSSGLKINRGADGPAALVISEQQRAQISGLQTALDNTNKATSLVQTGEGALNEINSLLTKVRGLALDSANSGVNDANSLAANQAEIANALNSINQIAKTTQFGTQKLLDGSLAPTGVASSNDVRVVQATPGTKTGSYEIDIKTAAEKAVVSAGQAQAGSLEHDETLSINGVQINLQAGLSQSQVVARINEFSDQTNVVAQIEATNQTTQLTSIRYGSAAKIVVQSSVEAGARSTGFGKTVQSDVGVDVAGTIGGQAATGVGNFLTAVQGDASGLQIEVKNSGDGISTVGGKQGKADVESNGLTFQIGANAGQTASVVFINAATNALGKGASSKFDNLGAIDVSNSANAADALKAIDQAINEIAAARGQLSAFQANTLESNASNLRATLENTVAAESTIRDTDFATEIAKFTKTQVALQAGQTVLGNANQIPQLVASLLKG